jgi:hypothetical protein
MLYTGVQAAQRLDDLAGGRLARQSRTGWSACARVHWCAQPNQ